MEKRTSQFERRSRYRSASNRVKNERHAEYYITGLPLIHKHRATKKRGASHYTLCNVRFFRACASSIRPRQCVIKSRHISFPLSVLHYVQRRNAATLIHRERKRAFCFCRATAQCRSSRPIMRNGCYWSLANRRARSMASVRYKREVVDGFTRE